MSSCCHEHIICPCNMALKASLTYKTVLEQPNPLVYNLLFFFVNIVHVNEQNIVFAITLLSISIINIPVLLIILIIITQNF